MAVPMIIDESGVERALGNLIPDDGVKLSASWKVYGDNTAVTPMIPRNQWVDQPVSNTIPKWVKDQQASSACNAFATTTAMEGSRSRRTFGATQIRLSPAVIYNGINGGVDQGSTLEDGLKWAMEKGTCPVEYADELDWQATNWKKGYALAMREHRVLEAFLCPTFDHIASALLSGFEVVSGIFWGRTDKIDDKGWIADDPAGGVSGGHALNNKFLAKNGNRLGLKTVNSWSENWGAKGWCIIPETRFKGVFTGAWAIRSMVVADQELDGITQIQ